MDAAVALDVEQAGGERRAGRAAADERFAVTGSDGHRGLDDRGLGVRATARAGSGALAIETGASTTSTPSATFPISSAEPKSTGVTPCAAAIAAPRGDLGGTEVSPVGVDGDAHLARRRTSDRDRGCAARAQRCHCRRTRSSGTRDAAPRGMAMRARVVRRRAQLVLRATLVRTAVRLLLLGDGHEERGRIAASDGRSPNASKRPCRGVVGLVGCDGRSCCRRAALRWRTGRIEHFLAADPGGAWVAVDEHDEVIGVALSLLREDLWGLSLLAVAPASHGRGVGRALLDRALAYGADARGG